MPCQQNFLFFYAFCVIIIYIHTWLFYRLHKHHHHHCCCCWFCCYSHAFAYSHSQLVKRVKETFRGAWYGIWIKGRHIHRKWNSFSTHSNRIFLLFLYSSCSLLKLLLVSSFYWEIVGIKMCCWMLFVWLELMKFLQKVRAVKRSDLDFEIKSFDFKNYSFLWL